ncbi:MULTISPECIES: DUF4259 domain-containing protein [Hymenobacter]|nr:MULTISPECIES: DUF4259 domain-containing protein [Hymenobacter]
MSTWGYYNFDNDTAADFAGAFRDNPDEASLADALQRAANGDQDIDATAASEALAAAEIVAAIQGHPAQDFPADLILVIRQLNPAASTDLRKMSRKAVKAIAKHSELQELWAGSEDSNNWQELQKDLVHRLKED